MALTFLTLAQRLRRKCRISGTGPTDVTGQSEEYSRVLDWTNEAYMKILRARRDWSFLRASASCPTVAGQVSYSPSADFKLTDFGNWALDYAAGDTFRAYNTAAGIGSEIRLQPIPYDDWRDVYQIGVMRSTFAQPVEIAQAPDFALCTGPIAAAGYTLVGDYYRVPAEMVNASDQPVFEDQFRMAIVYGGMILYGISEAAPEVMDEGAQGLDIVMRQMERRYLPRITV